jgi:molecular chaperone GrpE (heat shock protein)
MGKLKSIKLKEQSGSIVKPAAEQRPSALVALTEQNASLAKALNELERKVKRLDKERQQYRNAMQTLRDSVARSLTAIDSVSSHGDLEDELKQLRRAQGALAQAITDFSEQHGDGSPPSGAIRRLIAPVSDKEETISDFTADHKANKPPSRTGDNMVTVADLSIATILAESSDLDDPDDGTATVADVDMSDFDEPGQNLTPTVDDIRLSEIYKQAQKGETAIGGKGPMLGCTASITCKGRLKAIIQAADVLQMERQMPLSGGEIDLQLIAEVNHRCLSTFEDYLAFHDCNKAAARKLYKETAERDRGAALDDFWQEHRSRYDELRTNNVIEKVFDFLEQQIMQFEAYDYYEVIDYFANAAQLQRTKVREGDDFDATLHRTVKDVPAPKGAIVAELRRSGYVDLSDGLARRRAFVMTKSPVSVTLPRSAPSQDFGDVPPHPDVEFCRKKFVGLKLALVKMVNMPGKDMQPLHAEVKGEISQRSSNIHMKFMQFHKEKRDLAQQQFDAVKTKTPDEDNVDYFWDLSILQEYRDFATVGFVEQFLDPVERKIARLKVPANLKILDLLAGEMGMDRMAIVPGCTVFDPALHRLKADAEVPEPGKTVIAGLYSSGYTSRAAKSVLRQATVKAEGA